MQEHEHQEMRITGAILEASYQETPLYVGGRQEERFFFKAHSGLHSLKVLLLRKGLKNFESWFMCSFWYFKNSFYGWKILP